VEKIAGKILGKFLLPFGCQTRGAAIPLAVGRVISLAAALVVGPLKSLPKTFFSQKKYTDKQTSRILLWFFDWLPLHRLPFLWLEKEKF
jgi:hypothetical protein